MKSVGLVPGSPDGSGVELIDSLDVDMGRAGAALPAQCGPHRVRAHRVILQRSRAALGLAARPALGRSTGDTERVQRPLGRQVRLLSDPDDLELLGCGILQMSHVTGWQQHIIREAMAGPLKRNCVITRRLTIQPYCSGFRS